MVVLHALLIIYMSVANSLLCITFYKLRNAFYKKNIYAVNNLLLTYIQNA